MGWRTRELTEILNQEIRLFHAGEVATSGHFCSALDVVNSFGIGEGRPIQPLGGKHDTASRYFDPFIVASC